MGLIGGMARTAVVAGTATAVSNRVSRRQANRWQDQADAQAYQEQQYAPPPQQQYAPPPQQYAPPTPPQGDDMDDKIASLTKLGQLRDQGILTDAEFEAQKAKILAG
jgi:Short C-terminal domain